MTQQSILCEATQNQYSSSSSTPKKRGNPQQIGVYNKLIALGIKNPDAVITKLLEKKSISEIAKLFSVALSTMSRYCDKKGIRAIRRHKSKINQDIKKIDLPPPRNTYFRCDKCHQSIPEQLRGRLIKNYCSKCERHQRQSRT